MTEAVSSAALCGSSSVAPRASPAPSPVFSRGLGRVSPAVPADETHERQPVAAVRPFGVNVPEKIIFCLDQSKEMGRDSMKSVEPRTVMELTRRAISGFLRNKHLINPNHEFALLVLRDQRAQWYRDLLNDPERICMDLDYVNPVDDSDIDLTTIFDAISERVTIPPFAGQGFPPAYVVRAILVYGRSHCRPDFRPDSPNVKRLLQSPNFFLDTIYIHEPPSDKNKCKEIYEDLWHVDERESAYFFEVSRLTKLLERFTMLLAHPLQRPAQADTNYSLMPD